MSLVSQVIHTCGKLGVSFALDDFGTGYSSLAFLKRLPVDVLKIDQTFVRDMLDDPEDLTIVEGMLGLASAFRRQAIAEGVETVEQGILLLRLGCQVAQGFGIARPMPAADLPAWVASWSPDPQMVQCASCSIPLTGRSSTPARNTTPGSEPSRPFCMASDACPPSLDPTQCRLGTWMSSEVRSLETRTPALAKNRVAASGSPRLWRGHSHPQCRGPRRRSRSRPLSASILSVTASSLNSSSS